MRQVLEPSFRASHSARAGEFTKALEPQVLEFAFQEGQRRLGFLRTEVDSPESNKDYPFPVPRAELYPGREADIPVRFSGQGDEPAAALSRPAFFGGLPVIGIVMVR